MKDSVHALGAQWLSSVYVAAVSLGLTFALGRVMGPETFGGYSYVLTVASLFLILQDGGFKTLLFRERTPVQDQERRRDDGLSGRATGHVLVATVVGLALALLLPSPLAVAVAVACFGLQALVNFVSSELRAGGAFGRDAIWLAAARTAGAVGVLAGLWLAPRDVWPVFAGWACGLAACLLWSRRALAVDVPSRPVLGGLMGGGVLRACLAFMVVDAATTLYYRVDIILLEHMGHGGAELGQYAAAYRFLDGVVLLAAPLGAVWFRILRRHWLDHERFMSLVRLMSLALLGAAGLVVAAGLVLGEAVVLLTFGPEYGQAVRLLPWVLAAVVFVLPNGILTQAAIACGAERMYALAACVCAGLNVVLNWLLIPRFGAFGAAGATVITEAVLTALLVWGLARRPRTVPEVGHGG